MRRNFLKQFLALFAASSLPAQEQSSKHNNYHITLYSGGTAVKEWDADSYDTPDGIVTFTELSGGATVFIMGTMSIEEKGE